MPIAYCLSFIQISINEEKASVYAELDTVVKGIKPDFFLTTILKAFQAIDSSKQSKLQEMLIGWISDRNYLSDLQKIVAKYELEATDQEIAMGWLQQAGIDTTKITEAIKDSFYGAYMYADKFGSQATLNIFWYVDRQKRRVRGINFLIDYNPPWYGSVKDIIYYPSRSPQDALRDFIGIWTKDLNETMPQISAEKAKQEVIKSLNCNRKQKIRLHHDLIACRQEFARYILTLPDTPETPVFNMSDFDALSFTGEKSEKIQEFEQTVGRQIILKDGTKQFIDAEAIENKYDDY